MKLQVSALVRLITVKESSTDNNVKSKNKDIVRAPSNIKVAIRGYYEQLYSNTFIYLFIYLFISQSLFVYLF